MKPYPKNTLMTSGRLLPKEDPSLDEVAFVHA